MRNFLEIAVEQCLVFFLQVVLQVISVQDALKLAEKLQGVIDVGDYSKVVIDVALQRSLDIGHVDVELNKITVKGVVVEVKQLVVLLTEPLNGLFEADDDWLDVLQVMLLKGLELLDSAK